jgi:hypothetical protein
LATSSYFGRGIEIAALNQRSPPKEIRRFVFHPGQGLRPDF